MAPFACEIIVAQSDRCPRAVALDVGNLLQIAASALHLVENEIGDAYRPLIHASPCAIRQNGRATARGRCASLFH